MNKCNTRFRPFIGATLKQLETYVKPILNDDTRDVLILHVGCNDISNKQLTETKIVDWIVKIGRQCKESNVSDVFISSLICTAQKRLNDKVIAASNVLKRVCKLNGLGFFDNSNICSENLFEDGLHLNDDGKVILTNNFIYVLNRFILSHRKTYNGTSKNDFRLKAHFHNDNDESSNISNSSEVKQSYPSICDDMVGNPDLRAIRKKNLNKLIIAQLNVNSLKNKLEFLKEQIQDNIDILMISETKIDASFPVGQFLLNGYSTPFRLDRNANGGGILLYIREDIPSKLLLVEENPIEGFFVKINLRNKKKWPISCCYNPQKTSLSNHTAALSKSLDLFTTKYERLLFLGDFNVGMEDSSIKVFCSNYNLTSMINKPTCYKDPDKPTCIDLILTNCPRSFQNPCVIVIGLSDFYMMIAMAMKTSYRKIEPRVINYRDYESFPNEGFRESLLENIKRKLSENSDKSFSNFTNTCNTVLDKQLPRIKRHVRGNQLPFMNKTLSKAIMLRTKLRNKFFKNRSNENQEN